MELRARTFALYGRFTPGVRDHLAQEITGRTGRVLRDLTRRADILVIGARADSMIDNGALPARLAEARRRGKAIFSEAAFRRALAGSTPDPLGFPLATALTQSGAAREDALLLSGFDLVSIKGEECRFGDVAVLKSAAALRNDGCSSAQVIAFLREARRAAPVGRHKVVVMSSGQPALEWEDEFTTLDGQRFLPLDMDDAGVDDLFEVASLAEADGRNDEAVRFYDMCARADRADPITLYNLGNIHLREERWTEAVFAYRRALARDQRLVEARYNLAQALERVNRIDEAIGELREVLHLDRQYVDAHFNLAKLLMKRGRLVEAKQLFEKYVASEPSSDWATKARKAITYCSYCLAS
jgi:tetratricopeptide (TPR) repeat protein